MHDAQGPITIPNTGAQLWQQTTARYDYETDPFHCPICGGMGIPWRGWFHCDGTCHAIAIIEDGRTFLPVPRAKGVRHTALGTKEGEGRKNERTKER